ncbi:TIGR03086 family metal-binding protein [Nocardia donostiensis]|uniref:TIGR03086 family protein n=1 Tax=Nocardia donostiensis TaxID=1538463 RepID=A0A1W0BCB1_9NOCA|nr:TIGR03086 family metal-binding protein [Nocardia donostiensis]ONM47152.1 TIGR03086 family protein [Nocardia donostiensis]OQS15177.1 TIGR03086 family protein [Nocardia donostiensis]OQS20137.1 TIGR03086 family protein [Nocardia donostiensis]
MAQEFDLQSAADTLAKVVAAIPDDRLTAPTPCAQASVGDLLAHIVGLTEAFRQAATKESVGRSASPSVGPGNTPPADWRTRIPEQLTALVAAWREPEAWVGDTEAGGVTMPAAMLARVTLDELVIHAWDLARATGRRPEVAQEDLEVLLDFLRGTPPEGTPGLFGPIVPIPHDAPLLHRVLGLTGRDPSWTG